MKIECDVCEKEEATIFCPSDEAALCDGCDRTIHNANKLSRNHPRFSLHHHHSPLCDICQEKRAYVFCQEDRAILCIECDPSIHKTNEHTQKHNRFLLTGVKLSASAINDTKRSSVSNEIVNGSNVEDYYYMVSDHSSVSTSSISEYLIEKIPGYCFEDLLDASFPPTTPNGGLVCDDNTLPDRDR
ncbi:B-box zinc finger protein 20 isoform X2 [Senna tora]|uniref:B-box zinc finger protein 20 isoform X2 n=1 Tax=Senna tora TaxID=362788 RepID=A0A834X9K6_9FABA|nr:B-box zinc finger protein 20 isoform X2 [Senna tora]